MVLYRITLVPLVEELRAVDIGLLSLFYADDAAFDGSAQRRAQLFKLLMKRGRTRDISPNRLSTSSSWTSQGKERRRRVNLQWRGLT